MGWRRAGVAGLLVLAAVLPVATAGAAEPAAVQLSEQQAAELATELFERGRIEEARRLILPLRQASRPLPQVVFLSAQLALHDGRLQDAIDELRRMLAQDATRLRVRLELARALHLAGELEAARYHFEIALGGTDLPPATRRNITAHLREIAARSSIWGITLVVGADSNANQATANETVVLLGQSFVLDDDARARRATGAVASVHGRQAFGSGRLAFLRGYLEGRDYPGHSNDFAYAQFSIGRGFALGDSLLSLEAGTHGARFQGRYLYSGALAQLSHARRLAPRLSLTQTLQWKRLDYDPVYDHLSGDQAWLSQELRYALAANAALDLTLALGAHRARDDASSYRGGEARIAYLHEFDGGLSGEVRVAANRFDYGAALPLFEGVRHDRQLRLELDLTRRDWRLFGFAPRLSLTTTRNRSTIPLFDYRRNFIGAGLTREF